MSAATTTTTTTTTPAKVGTATDVKASDFDDDSAAVTAAGRVTNFGAGPAALPLSVLLKAQSELLNFNGNGMSVLEMSHRSTAFEKQILETAMKDLRELLAIPANYKILFLQGGATAQFASVPLNLFNAATLATATAATTTTTTKPAGDGKADASAAASASASAKPVAEYVVNGAWSEKAAAEAAKYLTVHIVANSKKSNYTHIPAPNTWQHYKPAAGPAPAASSSSSSPTTAAGAEFPTYLHYCANETVHGVEYPFVPVPSDPRTILVADHSSNFCSKPIDVTKFGLIYAGAQKNVGPAGVTIVIVREDLLKAGIASPLTPSALSYKQQSDAQSMLNTPPTFNIYLMGLMFAWIKAQGGLPAIAARNAQKAKTLYDVIEQSKLFVCPVTKEHRSAMNVVFVLNAAVPADVSAAPSAELSRKWNEHVQKHFVATAEAAGMVGLEGHRSVGGMRVSLYNAITVKQTQRLATFMREFEANPAAWRTNFKA